MEVLKTKLSTLTSMPKQKY